MLLGQDTFHHYGGKSIQCTRIRVDPLIESFVMKQRKDIPVSKNVPGNKKAEQQIQTSGANSTAPPGGEEHFKSVETDADRKANRDHIHDHACQGCPQCRNI